MNTIRSGLGAAAVLLMLAAAPEANAQAAGGGSNCERPVFSRQTEQVLYYNSCVAGDLARFQDLYIPHAIQRALAASFGIGPQTVEPTGLDGLFAEEAASRLEPSSLNIAPASDTAAAAAAPANRWNTWVDGRALYTDYVRSAGDLDGPTYSGLAGIDYKLTSKFSMGVIVSADSTDLQGTLTDHRSHSIGAGPYVGYVIDQHLVWSANLLGSSVNSKQAGGLLEFQTGRLQASTGVNGYWYHGTTRFNPSVTLAWSKDWEDETSHFGLPDRTIETMTLTPAVQIGKTLRLSDSTTVEPWAGAALDWALYSDIHVSGGGGSSISSADLRLQAGFNFGFGTRTQLAVTAEAGGLLDDDTDSYSVEANLAVQF